MKTLSILSLLFLMPIGLVAQQDDSAAGGKTDQTELEKKIQENPDDLNLFNEYMSETISGIVSVLQSEPEKSVAMLDAMDKFLATLKPETPRGKQILERAKSVSEQLRSNAKIAMTSFEEIQKKLEAEPGNQELLNMLVGKTMSAASPLVRTEPDKAEAMVEKTKKILTELKGNIEDEEAQKMIDSIVGRAFGQLESAIASGKKLVALIGKDAAELKVDDWANGEPLSPEDLKGKVVLLDFWAVWCGPCIATFPHLKEWHEKYADKGLVIIGITRYYDYEWNEEAGAAQRSQEEVSPEAEQEMLKKFAESYGLKHRFAIQQDTTLSEYYGVSGIPHAVLIDQEGKIRLIRVGSGEQNAKDIEAEIEKLLGKA